jgi:hypothetical protein
METCSHRDTKSIFFGFHGRLAGLLLAVFLLIPGGQVDALNTIKGLRVQDGAVIVEFNEEPGSYYLLESSTDLVHWGPADMSAGIPSTLDITPGVNQAFFRAIPYSKYAPLDTDGDGIDDLYELTHNLDPLDPTDGSKLAPGGGGMTNYQVYLSLFKITSYRILQRESREVSVYNLGSPSATFEANSREQSIFNFGSPSATVEANSREISIYNGQAVPISDLAQIESREWSVFNFNSPSASYEATSREVSLYNGQAVPVSDLAQVESREVSVFNFGSPSATLEAISREVSVLNFTEP